MRIALHILILLVLTVITQIGGFAWLFGLLFRGWRRFFAFSTAYVGVGVLTLYAAVPFGRVPLPCFGEQLRVANPLFCALNRHYVTPELYAYSHALAGHMNSLFPGTETLTLDANFPFLDGFPLLPHLSHDDGRKLDLAFYYQDVARYLPGQMASPIGYWAFEDPGSGGPLPCTDRTDVLTLRWDMGWLRPLRRDIHIEERRLRSAVDWLANNPPEGYRSKILLEPHLKRTLGLTHSAIRFQGCRAARHDDHIHVQIEPV